VLCVVVREIRSDVEDTYTPSHVVAKMRIITGVAVWGTLSCLAACSAAEATEATDAEILNGAPVVSLANGTYFGRYSPEYSQDFFLGIPFAQPPTGSLRFVPPQSLNSTFEEPRNATEYGPECIGYGFDQWILGNYISEDCLTVNVIRPEGASEGDDLPVAVWIHGGVSRTPLTN
jgi:hypothetical protein